MKTNKYVNEKEDFVFSSINDLPSFDQYLVERHLEEIANLDEKELSPYQKFFQEMLKKYNVSSPSSLSGSDKGKFFREIKAEWSKHPDNKK